MSNVCYECCDTGSITEKEIDEIAQFVTAKKYSILYNEELSEFKKQSLKVYALPFNQQPTKNYYGVGRMGLSLGDKFCKKLTPEQNRLVEKFFDDFAFADKLMQTESTARQFLSLFKQRDYFELIWVRNSGSKAEIPNGYDFIGYDISYPCDYSGGFSIICDCMFICRWHGCDEQGTLFLSDFNKLNDNGLFDEWQAAYDYMVKYLNEAWTERGEYCIFEVYRKADT